jgi:hypothetical protein
MEQGDGCQPQTYMPTSTSPPILRRVVPAYAERQRVVPRLGDVWIPKSAVSPNHFMRLYIPGVDTSRNQPKCNQSIYDYMRLIVVCD